MAVQVPPLWLVLASATAYTVFFAFYGAEVIGASPEPTTPGTTNQTALRDEFANTWDFIQAAGTVVTFGAFSDVVELAPIISWVLFMVLTLPWGFYVLSAIIEGVKALGGLIPFT